MAERLTHSKRSSFLFCPRQYFNRYERRLELLIQRPGRRRGSIFTDALRAARVQADEIAGAPEGPPESDSMFSPVAVALDSIDEAYVEHFNHISTPEEMAELELERVKVRVMVRQYLQRYSLRPRREVEFELSYRNPQSGGFSKTWKLAGVMDGLEVVGPKRGRVVEDKFVGQIQRPMIDKLPLDLQTSEYVQALASKGWSAEVAYRHTLYPGINPARGKEPPAFTPGGKVSKAKRVPPESLEAFEERCEADALERPEHYFDEQVIVFPTSHLADFEQERWEVGQMIVHARERARVVGPAAFPKNPTRCAEWGGCIYLPLCTGRPDADALYRTADPDAELSERTAHGGE